MTKILNGVMVEPIKDLQYSKDDKMYQRLIKKRGIMRCGQAVIKDCS